MNTSVSSPLDTFQEARVARVKAELEAAEASLTAQSLATAKQHLNSAAVGIRTLERLHARRRGGPRQKLLLLLRYLSIWQRVLAGRLEAARSNPLGERLISKALEDALEFQRNHPNAHEPSDLLSKLEKWQPS